MKRLNNPKQLVSEAKLTKKLFMNIPKGLYLASAECNGSGQELFAGVLAPPKEREEQWKSIKEAGVADNSCYVALSKAAFEEWRKHWPVA